jgi:hypothetical protein
MLNTGNAVSGQNNASEDDLDNCLTAAVHGVTHVYSVKCFLHLPRSEPQYLCYLACSLANHADSAIQAHNVAKTIANDVLGRIEKLISEGLHPNRYPMAGASHKEALNSFTFCKIMR